MLCFAFDIFLSEKGTEPKYFPPVSCRRKFPTNLSALLLADLYYTRLSLDGCSAHLSQDSLLELYQTLHSNLSSNVSKVPDTTNLAVMAVRIVKPEPECDSSPADSASYTESFLPFCGRASKEGRGK